MLARVSDLDFKVVAANERGRDGFYTVPKAPISIEWLGNSLLGINYNKGARAVDLDGQFVADLAERVIRRITDADSRGEPCAVTMIDSSFWKEATTVSNWYRLSPKPDWQLLAEFRVSDDLAGHGSSGFGRKFEVAGYGQWGPAMQDGVTAGVDSLVREGIADPGRLCIYGGYAAL